MLFKMKITMNVLLLFLSFFLISSCAPNKNKLQPHTAVVLYAVGENILVDSSGEHRLQFEDEIKNEGIIRTKDKSELVLQIETIGVVKVLSNTEVLLCKLNDQLAGTVIELKSGKIFSKIIRNEKRKFEINTNTSTLAVRGTEFLSEHYSDRTIVSVRDGVVNMKLKSGTKNADITRGKRGTQSNDAITETNLSKIESLQLKKMAVREYIENFETIGDAELADKEKYFSSEEEKIEKEIQTEIERWNNLSGLERLREQGKALTELSLKDGSSIIGCLMSQNAAIVVLDTGNGVIKIPKNDIIRRKIVK